MLRNIGSGRGGGVAAATGHSSHLRDGKCWSCGAPAVMPPEVVLRDFLARCPKEAMCAKLCELVLERAGGPLGRGGGGVAAAAR